MKLINKLLKVTNRKQKHCKYLSSPALEWHPVHGDNILLTNNNTVATRRDSFCKSVVFSQRPLMIGEKIFIRLLSVSEQGWKGGLRLGVSGVNPNTWTNSSLPKYLCPDLTNRGKVWARAMSEKYVRHGAVVFFSVKTSGDLVWGVDGKEKGVLVSGVDISSPVWAVVDVYGSTKSVKLLDPKSSLNNIISKKSVHEKKESCSMKVIHNQDILRQKRSMTPAAFSSSCYGQNISISQNGEIASRSETEFCNGYVFLNSTLQPGDSLLLKVLETEDAFIGSIAFGLTTADPKMLCSSELPDDSEHLTMRPEYWIHDKDVLADPQVGDELLFSISLDGAVLCSVNGGALRLLFHTDVSLSTRPFIDVFGSVQKIQVLGIKNSPPRPKSYSPVPEFQQPTECVVCYESDVDCVLYSCGHMCMCYQCAVQQWSKSGECPLCRASIRDVIRTYRA